MVSRLTPPKELLDFIHHLGAETIAAFLFEPIIGAVDPGLAPSGDYYHRVAKTCRDHDILLIADEVMCGLGRAGRKLAIDHWSVVPDVVVLGKGLAAGYAPMAGIAVQEQVFQALATGSSAFQHGFTYSGHPVSAVVAETVLKILEEEGLGPVFNATVFSSEGV